MLLHRLLRPNLSLRQSNAMTLRAFLGDWVYWPVAIGSIGVAVLLVGFALQQSFVNVSLIYTEVRDQARELKRLRDERDRVHGP